MPYRFAITPGMLSICTEITHLLGKYEGLMSPIPQPQLRRLNRIKTIQGSLSIEGNSLSLDQVTDLIDDKKVIGPSKDILEVKNAITAYARLREYNPNSTQSIRAAHAILMKNLIKDAGQWRKGQVGIIKGTQVSHVAPPAKRIPGLMENLFSALKQNKSIHPLIRAATAHYEIEFTHPFSDGNGRIGRLWQQVHLLSHHPLFEYLSVESLIKKKQDDYYKALEKSDRMGNASVFVEFSLDVVLKSLKETLSALRPEPLNSKSRLEKAKEQFRTSFFTRRAYLDFFKILSTATASRDLKEGIDLKVLEKKGQHATTQYRFK